MSFVILLTYRYLHFLQHYHCSFILNRVPFSLRHGRQSAWWRFKLWSLSRRKTQCCYPADRRNRRLYRHPDPLQPKGHEDGRWISIASRASSSLSCLPCWTSPIG